MERSVQQMRATSVGNAGDGILVNGSSQNTTVGGVIPLGNVISGNTLNGIEVAGTASGFTTFNTFAGVAAFAGIAPNGNDGLLITTQLVGGLVPPLAPVPRSAGRNSWG